MDSWHWQGLLASVIPLSECQVTQEPKPKLAQCPPSATLTSSRPGCHLAAGLVLRQGNKDRIAATACALPSSSPHLTQGFLQMGSSVSFQASLPNCPPSSYPGGGVISKGSWAFSADWRPEALSRRPATGPHRESVELKQFAWSWM